MLDVAINRKRPTKHLIIETEEQIIKVLLLFKLYNYKYFKKCRVKTYKQR